MRLLSIAGVIVLQVCQAQEPAAPTPSTMTVPAGTKVELGLTSPIWANSAAPGENVYAQTTFPVAVNGAMAIPPGTYVRGTIDILYRPSARSVHAEFRMSFAQIVFANGYTFALPAASSTANVTAAGDVLLDNGSQVEMALDAPLYLDAANVAAAVRVSKPLRPRNLKSASLCRPTPATPGTPDTVIPGTPGTPPTVIPGGPGVQPTVMPGTPGTPATVIPGTPGSPELACPGPPEVTSAPAAHKERFDLIHPVTEAGQTLRTGSYEVAWEGLGPLVQVRILKLASPAATAPARVVALGKNAAANHAELRANSDGSFSLGSLQFKGRNFALRFEP